MEGSEPECRIKSIAREPFCEPDGDMLRLTALVSESSCSSCSTRLVSGTGLVEAAWGVLGVLNWASRGDRGVDGILFMMSWICCSICNAKRRS